MTSQAGIQTVIINILLDISKSKNLKDFLSGRDTSFRPLFVFEKALYEVKASG